MRLILLLAAFTAAAAPLRAQAPRVAPSGDPSVRDDTIYALAVRPDQHPDEDWVFLLDDGIVRFEADGRVTKTYRQVVQVLTREAAEQWAEHSFSWEPGRERLTVNWIRVIGADGRRIGDGPSHEQESRAQAALSYPVYTNRMVRRVTLAGVEPGTIVDYSYTTEVLDPWAPGDAAASWSVTTGRITRRSRYIVDAPAGLRLRIKEENWRWPRPVTTSGGRRTWVWATADVPRIEGEPFAARPNSVEVGIRVAAPRTWDDVARFYHGLSRGRDRLTPGLETRLAELVAGARTLEDSVRAVHRWVAQDIRYVSLSLGTGGYQPRPAAQVLETGYGDCKDKTTLFLTLLRRLGVRGWPVLTNSGAVADSAVPTISEFDHVIAAVELPGHAGYRFADLTAELTPFGEVPPRLQDGFSVLVRPDGRAEPLVLPLAPASANRSEIRVEGELLPDGRFDGRFTRVVAGSAQYRLRELFAAPRTEQERRDFIREIAASIFDEAAGDSLEAFDGRDLGATPRISLAVRGGRAVRRASGIDLLVLPMDNYASPNLVTRLEAHRPRRFPINTAAVLGPVEFVHEFRVVLPEGWRARLPDAVQATSVFGSYRASYAQEGRVLTVRRAIAGNTGVRPGTEVDGLIAWVRALGDDDVPYLVLDRPGR
jgi:transglutaminase-like putative cysteine protease